MNNNSFPASKLKQLFRTGVCLHWRWIKICHWIEMLHLKSAKPKRRKTAICFRLSLPYNWKEMVRNFLPRLAICINNLLHEFCNPTYHSVDFFADGHSFDNCGLACMRKVKHKLQLRLTLYEARSWLRMVSYYQKKGFMTTCKLRRPRRRTDTLVNVSYQKVEIYVGNIFTVFEVAVTFFFFSS